VVFTSKEGRFTVTFPEKPVNKTTRSETRFGPIETHSFLVEQKGRAFIASYSDCPKGSVTDENRHRLFDGARNGAVTSSKGKLISEKEITLGKEKHPGREILIERPEKAGINRFRVYLVGDRLYQAAVAGSEEFTKGKEAEAFLDSFKVGKPAILGATTSSGSIGFAGKVISFKVTGEGSVSGSADNPDNEKCTVKLDSDGTKHEVLITKTTLEYKGHTITLKNGKKLEVIGEGEKIRILVDGRQVFPVDKR
jgi:hypothetical protein